jgi:hypothetical protein
MIAADSASSLTFSINLRLRASRARLGLDRHQMFKFKLITPKGFWLDCFVTSQIALSCARRAVQFHLEAPKANTFRFALLSLRLSEERKVHK